MPAKRQPRKGRNGRAKTAAKPQAAGGIPSIADQEKILRKVSNADLQKAFDGLKKAPAAKASYIGPDDAPPMAETDDFMPPRAVGDAEGLAAAPSASSPEAANTAAPQSPQISIAEGSAAQPMSGDEKWDRLIAEVVEIKNFLRDRMGGE
jgi:hypothetical protein